MLRLIGLLLVAGVAISQAAESGWAEVDRMVELVNPAQNIDVLETNAFTGEPVSGIAQDIQGSFWFSLLVFIPFLILPQILLLYAIIAFRDKGDGRKAATWVNNHKLEIFWTAVPILALIIVAVPMVDLLYRQEAPPKAAGGEDQPLMVAVTGKQFSWVYEYPDYGIEPISTVPVNLADYGVDQLVSLQETAVFPRDRIANLTFTSLDVNHAWGVPAFGIRKDCIPNRLNWAWFKPEENGFFEGQCFELCGFNHGRMVLTAAVVDGPDFDRWIQLQHFRAEAQQAAETVIAGGDEAGAKLQTYLGDDPALRADRAFALRFWHAYAMAAKAELLRVNQLDVVAAQVVSDDQARRATIDTMIKQSLAALPAAAPAVEAEQAPQAVAAEGDEA